MNIINFIPIIIGLLIFGIVLYFLVKKIKEANKFQKEISQEISKIYSGFAQKLGCNYLPNSLDFEQKFRNTSLKIWNDMMIHQFNEITDILTKEDMYFFRSVSDTIRGQTETKNSVCAFEKAALHKDSIWIISSNIQTNEFGRALIKSMGKASTSLNKLNSHKEFVLKDPFFDYHKVYYTGNIDKPRMYITSRIMNLISEMEKKFNLPVGIKVDGNFVSVYTANQGYDYQFWKGVIKPTGKWGEYGYLRREDEIIAFIEYSKKVNRYFENY